MKDRTTIGKLLLLVPIFVFAFHSFASAEENSLGTGNTWVNGKWEGTFTTGEPVQFNLRLVDATHVEGSSRLKIDGILVSNRHRLTGTVDTDNIQLTAHDGSQEGVKYALNYVDGALKGTVTGRRGSKATTFRRVNYEWLNGRWSGTDALGGSRMFDFQVLNGNEIKGTAWSSVYRNPGGFGTLERPMWGRITDRDLIDFSVEWGGGHTERFVLKRTGDGTLQGSRNERLFFRKEFHGAESQGG